MTKRYKYQFEVHIYAAFLSAWIGAFTGIVVAALTHDYAAVPIGLGVCLLCMLAMRSRM